MSDAQMNELEKRLLKALGDRDIYVRIDPVAEGDTRSRDEIRLAFLDAIWEAM